MSEGVISVLDRFVSTRDDCESAQERTDLDSATASTTLKDTVSAQVEAVQQLPAAAAPAAAETLAGQDDPGAGRSVLLHQGIRENSAPRHANQTDAPVLGADGRATPELCHRPFAEDRFPVDWLRLAEHRFLVSVEWPAAHRFFAPLPDGRQDPMLVAETTRQATMMLAHAAFGVPVGDAFVMRELGYRLVAPDFTVAGASGAIDVVVDCSDVHLRAGRLVSMRVDLRFQRHGRLLATSMGLLTCTSARVYQRLRGERMSAVDSRPALLPAVPAHEVGRADRRDVVLALSKLRPGWRLRTDVSHPTLFARPNDHVPGMVLLEAARQAAASLTPGHVFHPASMRVTFQKYCELTEPCWILARHDTCPELGAVVRVEGLQEEEPVFTALLSGAVRDEA